MFSFSIKRLLLVVILLIMGGVWLLFSMTPVETVAADESILEDTTYSGRGSHLVGIRTVTIGEQLPATIWYPASQAGDVAAQNNYLYELKLFASSAVSLGTINSDAFLDAPVAAAAEPYPLVILSPGFAVSSQTYGWLAEHFASHGFVVISPNHDEQLDPTLLWRSTIIRPRDIQAVVSFVEAQTVVGGLFEGVIDVENTAVIGHSYGGYTALAAGGARLHTADFEQTCRIAAETDDPILFLCDALLPHTAEMAALAGFEGVPDELWPSYGDKRVKAVISLAGDAAAFGEAGLAEITVPLMTIGGTADQDSPYEWSTQYAYESAASERKVQLGLVGAEHMIFTGRCETVRRIMNFIPYSFCSDPVWQKEVAHDVVKQFATAFLLAELKRDTDAKAILISDTLGYCSTEY